MDFIKDSYKNFHNLYTLHKLFQFTISIFPIIYYKKIKFFTININLLNVSSKNPASFPHYYH